MQCFAAKSFTLPLLLAILISAATPVLAQPALPSRHRAVATVPDPAEQVLGLARLLRANDLAGLVQATLPPKTYQAMRQAYELQRLTPTTEVERDQFAEGLAKLSAPDAVDHLMVQIEPKLVEARPKFSAALMMGLGALQMALLADETELTAEERAALQRALPGLQQWLSRTDFLSAGSLRHALTLVADAVRDTGIRSVDDVKRLTFEQALAKAEAVVAASKQALLIYGLDLDAITDSMQVKVLAITGATARVRTTITLFDAPISHDQDLVLIDGHWYGEDAIKQLSEHAAQPPKS